MPATDTRDPDYFHRVVDCQWACPAHTPVPEYIRLIAQGRHDEAYLVNWVSNVFPGILGRTCDRPCEPACRRGRVEESQQAKPEPVAICRLKRVAADHKSADITARMPQAPATRSGKRVACVGAGPASLALARDLALAGHEVTVFDKEQRAAGFMRTQVPRFRLPEAVIDEEVGYITRLGVEFVGGRCIGSLRELLAEGWDAVFIGSGAPRGRDLDLPGRREAPGQIHIGLDWLASVSFGHVTQVAPRVLVLGGGNTAMDCCRSARRLGAQSVKVLVRSTYEDMKASPWEKEDAEHEGIPILAQHAPQAFLVQDGRLVGMRFEIVETQWEGGRRRLMPTGRTLDEPCDEVLIAVGQENAFPWIEADLGIAFDEGLPRLAPGTHQSTRPEVFFGGDAAFGPKNIITAVAHGHEAAISIDAYLRAAPLTPRPPPTVTLASQKMGLHQWSYDNDPTLSARHAVPWAKAEVALKSIKVEVELGFDQRTALHEARRCLNCDVQTVFAPKLCIECDACVDICPTDCLTMAPEGEDLAERLTAPRLHTDQPLFLSEPLKTGRLMVKDEDVCLHCGLCAERCPTGAWDMQKFLLSTAKVGVGCGVMG